MWLQDNSGERVFVHVCKRASVRVRRVARSHSARVPPSVRVCAHVRVRACMHVEVPGRAQAVYLLIKVQGRLTPNALRVDRVSCEHRRLLTSHGGRPMQVG